MKKKRRNRLVVFHPKCHDWFRENVGFPTTRWNLAIVNFRAENGDAECRAIMARHAEWYANWCAYKRLTQ